MEAIKKTCKKGRHPLRNLSLKWSFGLYALGCLAVALALSMSVTLVCSRLSGDLYDRYEREHLADISREGSLLVDGEIVDHLTMYTGNLYSYYTPEDRRLHRLYGRLTILAYPLSFGLSIALSGVVFYRRKLKRPLTQLNQASERIAHGDLDFRVQGENRNEMGRLLDSFETMRSALAENYRNLFRMMEERKSVQAAFAHDLRTPLTVLRGYSDYLRKYYPEKLPPEKVRQTLCTMDQHISRLENYVSLMGKITHLEQTSPHPVPVFLPAFCEKLRKTGIMLCGETCFHMRVEGGGSAAFDPELVERAFENFLSNALRHARSQVLCDVRKEEEFLLLCVEDDGPGFSPEALKRAAEPYFRDGARDGEHFGLGLYICRILAEKHGGALELSNGANGARVSARFRLSPQK
ncbi:MAG TPA: HAMP domain-containing histidine kinase [Candidatus Pullichristensenella excrementigallinarum]|uniref:histidine kinase n=1 Tax=Candidatus Pullichristensenella excrementigallinarum TaxID=2840907 RepID=A0A9D1IB77_9FIRM|nr:HAMP domain-containing histidine kinase [Candidatus Pullichristensenella excrementigallinarum]